MSYYVGWDCAYRTLGHCLVRVVSIQHTGALDALSALRNADLQSVDGLRAALAAADSMRACLMSAVEIISCNVTDVLDGKKLEDVNTVERAAALKRHVSEICTGLPPDCVMILESQPFKLIGGSCNVGSSVVSNQLAYEFCDKYETRYVHSSKKNKINMCGCEPAGSTQYARNKKLASANMAYFLRTTGQVARAAHIKKSDMNHVADSFLQLLPLRT